MKNIKAKDVKNLNINRKIIEGLTTCKLGETGWYAISKNQWSVGSVSPPESENWNAK